MLNHAWQYAQRVWLHIGRDNWRSRKAAEKIGASFSHDGMKELFGVVREYAFYTIEGASPFEVGRLPLSP
jgi:N-acetyltransferase